MAGVLIYKFLSSAMSLLTLVCILKWLGESRALGSEKVNLQSPLLKSNRMQRSPKFARKIKESASVENEFAVNLAC